MFYLLLGAGKTSLECLKTLTEKQFKTAYKLYTTELHKCYNYLIK